MPSKTRTIASLTSIIVMELLAAVPTVETNTINRILPFILHSFEGGITEDYRVCVHGEFDQHLLESLIASIWHFHYIVIFSVVQSDCRLFCVLVVSSSFETLRFARFPLS